MKLNKKQKLFIILPIIVIIMGGIYLFYCSNRSRNINVILITMDALRPDHLGCYGYQRNTSPNIDKLSKEGVLFTQAIAQSSHTAASISSLVTSTYPNIHNVRDWGYQLSPLMSYTLPEILKMHGYATAFISDQIALSLIKGFERGFITYNTLWTSTFGPQIQRKKIINITDWAIDWLNDNKHKKFFLWLYFVDPHGPYTPPYPYNKIFLNDKYYKINKNIPISDEIYQQSTMGTIPRYLATDNITGIDYYISQYDGEIRYVDTQIGRLLEELKKMGLNKNTIVIIHSDHGEGMGEHNFYFCHGIFLYDELIRTPLIIKLNRTASFGKRIDVQVRSIDIMPTIIDILGIKNKKYKSIQGASLLPLISNLKIDFPTLAYSEFLNRKSVRTKEWKLIYDENNGQYELYNLKADPQESKNLIDVKKEKFGFLRQKLDKYLKQTSYQNKPSKPILDSQSKEKLKALGYVQ